MKKMYLNPEMEIFDLDIKNSILAGSNYDAGGDETEWSGGSGGGAENPDFGGKY